MDNSTSYLLKKLLKLHAIKIDESELKFQFESHPSYPSLHALTGVLNHFRINNLALEVQRDLETLSELPKAFIAHIKNERGENFALAIKSDSSVKIIYDKSVEENLSWDGFLEIWTGIIIAVEKGEEEIYDFNKKSLSGRITYSFAALSALLLFFFNKPDLFQSVHFILSVLGLIVSVFIVQHELGIGSKSLDKFCAGQSERTSCDDVLNSKGARIIGNITFRDIGLVYFAGIILSWLLLPFIKNADQNFIVTLSLSAVPFTLYSIYYQYFVVKKWCPLCLSVLVVLWTQALSLLLIKVGDFSLSLSLSGILLVGYSFITVFSLWYFLFPKLKMGQEHRKLMINHNRFKNNYNIFDALLSKNPKIDTVIENSSEIILGNKSDKALLKIVLITNPLCGHCKSAHLAIEPLLKRTDNQVQVCIRFNVNLNDRNSLDTRIALRLLTIYHHKKEKTIIQALHEAYSDLGSLEWLKRWDTDDDERYFVVLRKEAEWCNANKINFTPEILINGRSFPNEYERSDLNNFVNDLIEEQLQESQIITEMEYVS